MNIVDVVVLVILAIGIIYGMYKGFLYSLINIGTVILAALLSLLLSPIMSSNTVTGEFYPSIINYTDGAQRITDISLVHTPISELSESQISSALTNAKFPEPVNKLLAENIAGHRLADKGFTTLGEYFDNSVAIIITNIVCFMLLYLIIRAVCIILLNGVNFVTPLPVLKSFDAFLGGCCGAVKSILFLFVLFMIVPVIFTFLNYESIRDMLESSALGNFFYKYNFLLSFIGGI